MHTSLAGEARADVLDEVKLPQPDVEYIIQDAHFS